jgi:hypothetical protein
MRNNITVYSFWAEQGVRVYGVQRHFQQYFSYIVAVSFIGGENLSQVTDKLLHNVVLSTHRHEQGSNS